MNSREAQIDILYLPLPNYQFDKILSLFTFLSSVEVVVVDEILSDSEPGTPAAQKRPYDEVDSD